jgi:hypothetical protein
VCRAVCLWWPIVSWQEGFFCAGFQRNPISSGGLIEPFSGLVVLVVQRPVLRRAYKGGISSGRLETFTNESLRTTIKDHEKPASMVLDQEEWVAAVVKRLKERGLVSPYLRSFVVARVNPLR